MGWKLRRTIILRPGALGIQGEIGISDGHGSSLVGDFQEARCAHEIESPDAHQDQSSQDSRQDDPDPSFFARFLFIIIDGQSFIHDRV